MTRKPKKRVAILGAGAAGLSAAWYLEQKGHDVVVFESQSVVGGLCAGLEVDGRPYDLGAALLSWAYTHVFDFLERYDLETEPIAPFYLVDRANGRAFDLDWLLQGKSKVKLAAEVLTYVARLALHHGHVGNAGFRGLEHTDLCQPFGAWLDAHGLSELKDLLILPVTCYGYGELSAIPAAYALKYLNFGNFSTAMYLIGVESLGQPPKWPRKIVKGMHGLLATIAGDLEDVRTSCRVLRVDRNVAARRPIRIRSRVGEGRAVSEGFDALIVACKQDLETLTSVPLALTNEEHDLFAGVVAENYFTQVFEADGVPGGIDAGIYSVLVNDGAFELPPSGEPIFLGRIWPRTRVLNVYTAAAPGVDAATVTARAKAALARMNVKVGQPLAVRQWRYFPHATCAALKAGFYTKFEALQGRNDTYYAGSLACFECVEDAMAYADQLVRRYF